MCRAESTAGHDFAIQMQGRFTDIPYTTRVLIRYPSDPAKFSGNVIVEMLNPSATYDLAHRLHLLLESDNSRRRYLGRHDLQVCNNRQRRPGHAGLKKFDPVRYAALNVQRPRARAMLGHVCSAWLCD